MGVHRLHDEDTGEIDTGYQQHPDDEVYPEPDVQPVGMDYSAYSAYTGHPEGYTTAAPTLFGREPAMLLNVLTAVVALTSSTFLPLTVEQQGALNAAAAALLGLIVAIKVRAGTWVAALLALAQALIALALAWKFHLHPDVQAGILTLLAVVAGYATRQVVTAPTPPAVPGSSKTA